MKLYIFKKILKKLQKSILTIAILALIYMSISSMIYKKNGYDWTLTLLGWDSTRYIGLAKLLSKNLYYYSRIYAPIFFPLILSVGCFLNFSYTAMVIFYHIIEAVTISCIAYIQSKLLRQAFNRSVLFLALCLVLDPTNFIRSMYMPFSLALLESLCAIYVCEKYLNDKHSTFKNIIILSTLIFLIVLSNNLYHVILLILTLFAFLIFNFKKLSLRRMILLIASIISAICLIYAVLAAISLSYKLSMGQFLIKFLPKVMVEKLFKIFPFEKNLLKILYYNTVSSRHVTLARPVSLRDIVGKFIFPLEVFYAYIAMNLLCYIFFMLRNRKIFENLFLTYEFVIFNLLLFFTFLMNVIPSGLYAVFIIRLMAIYNIPIISFLLLREINFGLHYDKKQLSNILLILLVLAFHVLYFANMMPKHIFITDNELEFVNDIYTILREGGIYEDRDRVILVTVLSRASYPGLLNRIEGILWYFLEDKIVILLSEDAKDICNPNAIIERYINEPKHVFSISDMLQYYYLYIYYDLIKDKEISYAIILTDNVYLNRVKSMLSSLNANIVHRISNVRYTAVIVNISSYECDRKI